MKSRLRPPAFTMIELLIAIIIIAVLSVAIAVNLSRGALKANFDDQLVGIVHVLEQARTYSLTNFLIEDTEPADYYLITIAETGVTLEAYGSSGLTSTLENVELADGFTISATSTTTLPQSIYYVPPDGDIYIESETSGITEFEFSVEDDSGTYSETVSLNIYGGYPEVETL